MSVLTRVNGEVRWVSAHVQRQTLVLRHNFWFITIAFMCRGSQPQHGKKVGGHFQLFIPWDIPTGDEKRTEAVAQKILRQIQRWRLAFWFKSTTVFPTRVPVTCLYFMIPYRWDTLLWPCHSKKSYKDKRWGQEYFWGIPHFTHRRTHGYIKNKNCSVF